MKKKRINMSRKIEKIICILLSGCLLASASIFPISAYDKTEDPTLETVGEFLEVTDEEAAYASDSLTAGTEGEPITTNKEEPMVQEIDEVGGDASAANVPETESSAANMPENEVDEFETENPDVYSDVILEEDIQKAEAPEIDVADSSSYEMVSDVSSVLSADEKEIKDDNLLETELETVTEETEKTVFKTQTRGVTVTVFDPDGILPDGTQVDVKEVDPEKENTEETINEAFGERIDVSNQIEKKLCKRNETLNEYLLYEIRLVDQDGNYTVPVKPLKVTIEYEEKIKFNATDKDGNVIRMAQIGDDGSVSFMEDAEIKIDDYYQIEKVSFQTDSFSKFVLMDTTSTAIGAKVVNLGGGDTAVIGGDSFRFDAENEAPAAYDTRKLLRIDIKDMTGEQVSDNSDLSQYSGNENMVSARIYCWTNADSFSLSDVDFSNKTFLGAEYKTAHGEEAQWYETAEGEYPVVTYYNPDTAESRWNILTLYVKDEVEENLEYTCQLDNVTITASAPAGALPEGAVFQAEVISPEKEQSENEIKSAYEIRRENIAEAEAHLQNEAQSITDAVVYDLYFLNAEGERIEPTDEVAVSFSYADPLLLKGAEADGANVKVIHIREEGGTEVVQAEVDSLEDGTVQHVDFSSDSFSKYLFVSTEDTEDTTQVELGDYGAISFSGENVYRGTEENTPSSYDSKSYLQINVNVISEKTGEAEKSDTKIEDAEEGKGGEKEEVVYEQVQTVQFLSTNADAFNILGTELNGYTVEKAEYREAHSTLVNQIQTEENDLAGTYTAAAYYSMATGSGDVNELTLYLAEVDSTDNVTITVEPDRTTYTAGETVTFTVVFTNNTGKKLNRNNWGIETSVSDDSIANANNCLGFETQTETLNKNISKEFMYSIKIPEEMGNTEDVRFGVRFTSTDGTEYGSGSVTFSVEALTGVRACSVVDETGYTDLHKGKIGALLEIKNYETENKAFSYEVKLKDSEGKLLTEGTDYSITWPDGGFTDSLNGGVEETKKAEITLKSVPKAGDTYQAILQVTDKEEHVTEASALFTREGSDLVIIPDHEGPYLAGDTVKFTVTYTNGTGKNMNGNNWAILPIVDDPVIAAANSSVLKQMIQSVQLKAGARSTPIEFEITIPEDYSGDGLITVSAKIQQLSNNIWNDVDGAEDDYAFYVIPLRGVRVTEGKDNASNLGDHIFTIDYTLKNFSEAVSAYTYELKVVSDETELLEGVDYTVEWTGMPDIDPLDEVFTMEGKMTADPVEAVVTFTDAGKEKAKAPYQFTLTVTDTASGDISFQTVTLDTAKLEDIIPAGLLKKSDLSLLYYGNVENDPMAPFHNKEELYRLLTTSSKEYAQSVWDRYKYDLYDPNCFVGDPSCQTVKGKNVGYDYGETGELQNGKYKNDYPNFWDDLLAYSKDEGNSPFHHIISKTVNALKYSLDDHGLNFEDYFKNLKKTAGPDKGDENTERKYTVELSAETNPLVKSPQLYVFQIQTSWQMFDMLHANATKGNTGISTEPVNMAVGSCSNNTSMANLYAIKKALIRFCEFLKEYDDGSTMIAVTNVQHGGTHSMIDGYFSNDMDDVISGLIGWDTFGDCEHVHYTSTELDNAIKEIPSILQEWVDSKGNSLAKDAKVSAVIIGGPTENSTGTDGYGIPLSKTSVATDDTTRNSNLDHVYGIRVNEGTNVSGKTNNDGNQIISWLDIDSNQTLFKQEGNGFYVAPSEDDMYNALLDIYYKNNEDEKIINELAVVNDVVIEDTIQREFKVENVKAYYETTASDGNVSLTELPAADYSVVTDKLEDGSTHVKVTYREVTGKKKLVVKINTVAKEDYIGSNNVYTNVNQETDEGTEAVGPKISSYRRENSDGTEILYNKEIAFVETPQVNVPLNFEVTDGLTIETTPGTSVNLKDLAYTDKNMSETITKQFEDLLDNYPQINGTVTYQWVDQNGEPVGDSTRTTVTEGNGNAPAIPEYLYQTTSEDVGKTISYSLKVTFEPLDIEEQNINKVPVSAKSNEGIVHIKVYDSTRFTVQKKWEDDSNSQNTRPNKIQITLLRKTDAEGTYTEMETVDLGFEDNGEEILKGTTVSDDRNSWFYVWDELDKYDSNGKEYHYIAKEKLTDEAGKEYITFSNEDGSLITNHLKPSLVFQKRDLNDSTVLLQGAVFNLYCSENDSFDLPVSDWKKGKICQENITTNDKGELTLSFLSPGAYILEEIFSPDGYVLPEHPCAFIMVGEDGRVSVKTYAGADFASSEEYKANTIYEEKYQITNCKIYTLPQSGGRGTYGFTVSGVALLITALLLFIKYKRKEDIMSES